jgi:bacillithiol synthase
VKLTLEHLPADVLGLADHARRALAEGELGGLPVVRSRDEIPRPEDDHDPGTRAQLVLSLRNALAHLDPPGRVATSLNVLESQDTFCVITGQQPGFLGGPLYTLYKAMQACRLASELSRDWGTPVVPVFWNHADDHDLAEVQHAHLVNRNLDLQRVGLTGISSGRQPIGRVLFNDETHSLGTTRALVTQAFELFFPRPGESFASALTRTVSPR